MQDEQAPRRDSRGDEPLIMEGPRGSSLMEFFAAHQAALTLPFFNETSDQRPREIADILEEWQEPLTIVQEGGD